jgi:hypothetical protein
MITVATALYLIGILLVLTVLEVEEGYPATGLLLFAFFWPFVTMHMVIMDTFFPDQE